MARLLIPWIAAISKYTAFSMFRSKSPPARILSELLAGRARYRCSLCLPRCHRKASRSCTSVKARFGFV